ncbi:SNF1-interacting protein [Allomyces arbusculus]|nr:SNF1-interacting protein [Allomyces arbusculus]
MGNGHSRSARSRTTSATNDANADGLPPPPPAPARNGTLRHMRSLYTLRRSRRRNTAASAPAAAGGDAGSTSARESGDSRAGPAWVGTGVENADAEIDHTATLPYPPPPLQYGGPPLPPPPEPPLPPPIAVAAPPEPLDRAERVDGGHIAPMNDLYHDVHHYDPYLVREFIRARRLAPFYAGLEDVDEDEIQAIAARRGDQGEELDDEVVEGMEGVEKVEDDSAAEVKAWMATVGGAVECPICFLFYPSNINKSVCCDQPICTECFVQIKRPDADHPADCPYCVHPGFAVVYAPPVPRHDPTPEPTPVPTRTATPSPDHVPPIPSLPPIAIPTAPDALAAWPLTADPDSDDLLMPGRVTDSPRATPLSASAPASAALHAMDSARHASTLTVTATTYTRAPRSRAASTAALPEPEPATTDDAPSAAAEPVPAAIASTPVSSDDIRPAYVAHLIHEQQLAAWREEQDAQTAHLRRILYAQAAAAAAAAQAAAQAHHDHDDDDSDDDRPLRRAYSERARAAARDQRYVPRRPQAPMPMTWVPGSAEMPMPPLVDLAGEGLPPVEGRHRSHRHHRGHRPHLHHSASVSHVPDLEALLVAEAVRESLREVAMGGGAAAGPSAAAAAAVPPAAEAAGPPTTAAATHDADDDVPIATLLATTLGRAPTSAPAVPPRDAQPEHAPSPPEPVVPNPVPTANQLRAAPVERPRPVSVAHSESARPKSAHLGDDDVLIMDRMGGVALTSA